MQDVEGEAGGHAAVLDANFEGAGAGVGFIQSAQASAPVAEQVAGGIVTRGGGEDGEADGEDSPSVRKNNTRSCSER